MSRKVRARRGGGGGGLLERPSGPVGGGEAPGTTPDRVTQGNITFEPFYRVVLEYTLWNDNRGVAEKVVQAIPGIGRDNADRAVRLAKAYGSSILVTTTQDLAESYVGRLGSFGLRGHIEEA